MDVWIDTSQIKILQDFFNDLSHIDQRNIFIAAIRKAVRPMVETARNLAPHGKTGNLIKSIASEPVRDQIAVAVGVRTGGKYDGWYGKFFEPKEGIEPKQRFRKRIKGVRVATGKGATGKIGKEPFIRPAFLYNEDGMNASIIGDFYKAIDQKIIRVNKKFG
jgi:hypothetical protein